MKKFHEIHNEDGSIDDLFLMIEHSSDNLIDIKDLPEIYQHLNNHFTKTDHNSLSTGIAVYHKCPWYEAIKYCGSIPCTDGVLISHVVEYDPQRKLVKTSDNVWWNIRNAAYSHTLSRLAIGDSVITNNIKKIRTGLYAKDMVFDYSEVKEGIVKAIDFSKGVVQIDWNSDKDITHESINSIICVKKYNGKVMLPVYFKSKNPPVCAA